MRMRLLLLSWTACAATFACGDSPGTYSVGKEPSDRGGKGRRDAGASARPDEPPSDGSIDGRDAMASASSDASPPVAHDAGGLPEDDGPVLVEADRGGEVVDRTGVAVLRIDAGAIASDTEITIRSASGASWHEPGWAFEILPTSLIFDPPAELRIDVSGLEWPAPWLAPEYERQNPALPTRWSSDAEATVSGGVLTVPITHGGVYGLNWEALGLPDDCSVKPATFVACGGALEGDWKLEGLCYDTLWAIAYEVPRSDAPQRVPGCEVTPTGKLPAGTMFDARAEGVDEWPLTGTLEVTANNWKRSQADAVIPLLTGYTPQCGATEPSCEGVSMGIFYMSPNRCPGVEFCECVFVPPSSLPAVEGALTVEVNQFKLDDGAATPYCVDGNRLRVLESTPDGPAVTVYRR